MRQILTTTSLVKEEFSLKEDFCYLDYFGIPSNFIIENLRKDGIDILKEEKKINNLIIPIRDKFNFIVFLDFEIIK